MLIINIPVIHKGFLDFLNKNKKNIREIFIMDGILVEKISDLQAEIAAIGFKDCKKILNSLGFKKISLVSEKNIKKFDGEQIMMVNDQVSRAIKERYLKNSNILWKDVFLRWDKDIVIAEHSLDERVSFESQDELMIKEAYKEANNSTDWWRRVGAVLVKDKQIIFRSYNRAIPDDYTPYQVGNIRDYIKAGEKQELSPSIHAEQIIITEAAKKGISLENTELYITHFPCPVCAKLILFSGIKKCCFVEGASNLNGEKMLKLAGVDLLAVKIKK